MNKNKKPTWWICYLIGLLTVSLLALDYLVVVPGIMQKIVACGIVIGCYGLVSRWLRANRTALMHEAWQQEEPRTPSRTYDATLTPVQEHYNRIMEHYNQQQAQRQHMDPTEQPRRTQ